MFGMLDHRAHKLYWLLSLPFMVINYLIVFLAIFVAVLIAQSTSYGVLIKILIAYVALEAMLVVLGITQDLLGSALNRLFFFFIDVVPAHGANAAQAKAIVFMGRYFELSKKLENDIKNFTYEDALELNSQLNWRARLLFPSKERLLATVGELKRIYGETGQQPRKFGFDMGLIFRPINANVEPRDGQFGHDVHRAAAFDFADIDRDALAGQRL